MRVIKTIVNPKGVKISEPYCRNTYQDYSGERKTNKISPRRLRSIFRGEKRSWLQIYKEDIHPRKKMSTGGVKQ